MYFSTCQRLPEFQRVSVLACTTDTITLTFSAHNHIPASTIQGILALYTIQLYTISRSTSQMTNVPTVDNPSDSTRTRLMSDTDLDKISTKPGYCPSIRELIGKSTAAGETWMNSAAATKPNLIFLLKDAVQLLKHEKSAWTEVADLRKEQKDLLDPGSLMTEVKSQINSQLETFRTEVKASIQTEVKCALQTQTKTFADSLKSNTLNSNLIHASSGNPSKAENITQTSSQVRIDGIEETTPGSNMSDTNHLDIKVREVFNHLGIETNISFIERIGKPRRAPRSEQPSPQRPRTAV